MKYTSLMSRVVSGSWKQGVTSEKLKQIGTEVRVFRNEVVELFVSVYRLGLYELKFYSLSHSVKVSGALGTYQLWTVLHMNSFTFKSGAYTERRLGVAPLVCRRK